MDAHASQPMDKSLPTDPAGVTGQLATWLAGFSLADVPERVRERAKLITLDGIGCAIVGAQLPWSKTAVEIVTRLEGTGDAPINGWGRTSSLPAAALLKGTFSQGYNLDGNHYPAPPPTAYAVRTLSSAVPYT